MAHVSREVACEACCKACASARGQSECAGVPAGTRRAEALFWQLMCLLRILCGLMQRLSSSQLTQFVRWVCNSCCAQLPPLLLTATALLAGFFVPPAQHLGWCCVMVDMDLFC